MHNLPEVMHKMNYLVKFVAQVAGFRFFIQWMEVLCLRLIMGHFFLWA